MAGLLLVGGLGTLFDDGDEPASEVTAPTADPSTESTAGPSTESAEPTNTPPTRQPASSHPPARTSAPQREGAAPASRKAPAAGLKVVDVIDGDTIEVRGDGGIVPRGTVARVRLLEIDTPERGDCYAAAATARTSRLLPVGSTVRAERDVELFDRYDRYLLYLWNEDGTFVNESLVRSGHAEAVLYQPNDAYWPRISGAGEAAREADAGLWSACPTAPPTPAAPKHTPEPPPAADTPARPDLPAGPAAGIPDVDCSDLSGPVWVGPNDPHRLDNDGDGIGCDSG
ncbi:thermonuclease family protein [Streptomyces lincolnensis]|uniref:thermonuclease family protein n=1 Tax=Streptomyces lincolnensis TaxID=1915 RepID=UPI001E538130|nr:thermonuclease family protein [Streptomyces lincolnensis]